jgi:hypothetical protein
VSSGVTLHSVTAGTGHCHNENLCGRNGLTPGNPQYTEFIEMNSEQRMKIIEEKLSGMGMTINGWAKNNELDHRIVDDLIQGNLRGTHGTALNTRKKMEAFFGPIFTS